MLDFDLEDEVPFLVMDYAPNGSVRHRYPAASQPPIPVILAYIEQIADALHYLHSWKLIHRDIKPENLLLDRNDQVLLSDFGIAIATQNEVTGEQTPLGTADYIAPEQIDGHPCLASDQYALGVVVYEWLCGSTLFQGSMSEIVQQHLSALPPSLCEQVPDFPPAVEEVVFRALAKDPGQRFESVQAFAVALHKAFEERTGEWAENRGNSPFRQLSIAPAKKKIAVQMDNTPRGRTHHSDITARLQTSEIGRQQKKRVSRKRRVSRDIIFCYMIDLFASAALGSILYRLGVAPLPAELLVALCMVLLPLAYAPIRSNRVLFGLTCSSASVAILLTLPAHAPALFITLYHLLDPEPARSTNDKDQWQVVDANVPLQP